MLSERLNKGIFSGQETTSEKRPARERERNNCTFPNYVDSNPHFLLSFPFPEQPNAMATASGDWVRLFFKGGEKEKRLPPPFPLRQTWRSCWAVTRTRHTCCLSLHPQMHRTKVPALPRLSLSLHHLHVNFSPACHLPTWSSISFCLSRWQINGLSLEQVLTLLHWTGMEPPNRNSALHHQHWPVQDTCVHLCIQPWNCLWNPQGCCCNWGNIHRVR